MNEVENPRRRPGVLCPLFRKDVSEVCHNCDWYRPLPLEQILADGSRRDLGPEWGCTMTHLLKVSRDLVGMTEGTQQAVESFRNNVATASRMTLALQARQGMELLGGTGDLPKAIDHFNGDE